MDDAELNYYIFSIAKLGWINCDRFWDYEDKVNLIVNFPVSPDLKLKLVFSDINSVLLPTISENKYVFTKVPRGESVTLVAFKSKEGNLSGAFKSFEIDEKSIDGMELSDLTLAELTEKLSRI